VSMSSESPESKSVGLVPIRAQNVSVLSTPMFRVWVAMKVAGSVKDEGFAKRLRLL
jgi:hypothetical protein